MSESERPDWLVAGAEVVVVLGYSRYERVMQTRIKKVSTQRFTVHGAPNQFRISDQKHSGGDYGPPSRVYPLDSDAARYALAGARRRKLENIASHACATWGREKTEQSRQAVIDAFQALAPEDEE